MTGKYANPICKIPSLLLAAQYGSVYIYYIIVCRIIMIQTAHCSKSNILNFANRNLLIGGDHVVGIYIKYCATVLICAQSCAGVPAELLCVWSACVSVYVSIIKEWQISYLQFVYKCVCVNYILFICLIFLFKVRVFWQSSRRRMKAGFLDRESIHCLVYG